MRGNRCTKLYKFDTVKNNDKTTLLIAIRIEKNTEKKLSIEGKESADQRHPP